MEEGFLEIADFREITGLALETDTEISAFKRANSRASRKLAQYLGWTPLYKAMYAEAAISKQQGTCPTEEQLALWQEDPEKYDYFDEPDTEMGSTKLFPYYLDDANYFVDPAVAIYSVKLVKVLSADTQQFVTVYKFSPDDWDQKTNVGFTYKRSPIISWIEICKAPQSLPCACADNRSCYMLAVDGDWLRGLPDDLKYVLADLVLYYIQHPATIAAESTYAVKSESVDGHSVSYDTSIKNELSTLDGVMNEYMDLLKRYIGPYSPLSTKIKVM